MNSTHTVWNTWYDCWFDVMMLGFLQLWYAPHFIIGNSDNIAEVLNTFLCTPKK